MTTTPSMHPPFHNATPTPVSIPIPSATHILLTHIPSFLRNPRNLRQFLFSTTGHAKHISYTCAIRRSTANHSDDGPSSSHTKLSETNDNHGGEQSKSSNNETSHHSEDLQLQGAAAVVKLHHASQAMSLVRNWEKARKILDSPMNAFVWYQDGTLPALYPERSEVDKRMLESLWDTLYGERGQDEVGQTARMADENFVAKLVESYRSIEHWQNLEDAGEDNAGKFDAAAASEGAGGGGLNEFTTGVDHGGGMVQAQSKLDRAKVAAAAGGTYDEEADPLNAPEVLEAVAQFKKKLEAIQGGNRKKRAEYVNRRLQEEKVKAKERLLEKRKQEAEKAAERLEGNGIAIPPPPPVLLPPPPLMMVPGSVPPPLVAGMGGVPLPGALPPLPSGLPPPLPPPPAGALGEKRVLEESEQERVGKIPRLGGEIHHGEEKEEGENVTGRKERLDVGNASLAEIREANKAADKAAQYLKEAQSFSKDDILSDKHFPALREEHFPSIRKFVKDQIMDYLGEEEATLIDFVMNHLKKEEKDRGTLVLLEEMKMVLEEDGETFVVDLFHKVVEILLED